MLNFHRNHLYLSRTRNEKQKIHTNKKSRVLRTKLMKNSDGKCSFDKSQASRITKYTFGHKSDEPNKLNETNHLS